MGFAGRFALAALIVAALADRAAAGRVVVADTHAEADLVDEAGSFTLLLRAALDRPGRPVTASHELRGVVFDLDRAAEVLVRFDAEALIACDLERHGTGLRVAVIAIDRAGKVAAAATVTAGDGDLSRLVAEAVRVAAPLVGAEAAVPQVSFGQVRPFVRASAALARGDLAAAAGELEGAESVVPLKVSSIGVALRSGWAGAAVDQPTALAIALAAGTPQDVFDLAQTAAPRDRGARALAHLAIAANDAAAAELVGTGDEPLLTLAAARLAFRRGQGDKLAAAVQKLLARREPYVPVLALLAELPDGAVSAALEATALRQAAADPRLARLASVLGLRAAQRGGDVVAVLAVIRVVELDDAEVARLRPLVDRGVVDGTRPALRLAAELAARSGDRDAVEAAARRWLGVAADDPAAQIFRGRLAVAAMRLDEARVAFAAARADRELARVAIAAGDWATAERLLAAVTTASAEKQVIAAQLALARGDVAAARLAVDAARALAPASAVMLQTRATTLERGGDPGAAAARSLAVSLGLGKVTVVDGPADGSTGPSKVRSIALDSRPDAALVTALEPLVAALPLPAAGAVAVVELPAPGPGLFTLREARPRPLRPALSAALERRGLTVVNDGGAAALARARVVEPLARDRLEALADDLAVPTLVFYQLRADGGDARVRLIGFDRKSGAAHDVTESIPGTRHGLVGWNGARLQLIAVVIAAIAVLIGFWFLRGRSRVVVEITLDPDGSDEALCIEVTRSSTRPTVDDPGRFRKETRKDGHEVTRRAARLAGPRTVFRVSPGTWYVHVFGVYTRDHGDRVVPPLHSKKLEIARGATGVAAIDLGLAVAEIKIAIHDPQPAGIAIWFDSELADKVYTDADGHATLYATLGQHMLVIDAHDMRIEKLLPISAAQIEKVTINLPRERRRAEVSEGLTLGPTDYGPAIAPEKDDVIGTMVERGGPASPTAATDATQVLPATAAPTTPRVPAPAPAAAATLADEPELNTRVLGRYRIEAELGRGAMGVVFKAWDENLERTVAVKVLSRAVREIPQAMTFFVQEAKALAQLNHPNVVAVHDQASDAADTYIIMEFVDGTTVDRLLRERGTLPVRTALGIVDQLCSGLGYAHSKKVIHRDIKPANIFVSREKVVKLGDFGIARVLRELEIRQTDVRGTPLYMAPEQINGTNINHRADLYAVGCTLFELCAGRPPFVDGNVMAHHLFTEPPLLSSMAASIPPLLDVLITACLVKDSSERIGSAADIQARLRSIAADLPR